MKHKVTEVHRHHKFPRLAVDLRSKSRFYQARTYFDGRLRQHSTKTTDLATALKLAEQWYQKLLGATVTRHPTRSVNPTMKERFGAYSAGLLPKQRAYARMKWSPIETFWGTKFVNQVSTATFHDFYTWRRRQKIENHTLHKDTTLIRQILKHAAGQQLIPAIPFIPKIGKIAHNPRRWLDKAEFRKLVEMSAARIAEAAGNPKLLRSRQDCHDFMIFMVNSMMRVEEVRSLRFDDCRVSSNSNREKILICDVRVSKTGGRPGVVCLPAAAAVFERRRKGHVDLDPIFPRKTRDAFRALLEAAGLYRDQDGRTRNLRSLRSTGISQRVLEDAASLQLIANNSGTSIGSINNFYAKHLRGTDAQDSLTQRGRTRRPRKKRALPTQAPEDKWSPGQERVFRALNDPKSQTYKRMLSATTPEDRARIAREIDALVNDQRPLGKAKKTPKRSTTVRELLERKRGARTTR